MGADECGNSGHNFCYSFDFALLNKCRKNKRVRAPPGLVPGSLLILPPVPVITNESSVPTGTCTNE